MRLSLARGPELIDEIGNAILLELDGLRAEFIEGAEIVGERVGTRRIAVIARSAATKQSRGRPRLLDCFAFRSQ